MPSNIIKYPWYLSTKFLNSANSTGDSTAGGGLATVPGSNTGAIQGIQDNPGDRILLGAADALALSDNSVGNLYGGIYQYVATRNNSTSSPSRGHAAFWDLAVADSIYRVNSDNAANITTALFAGVYINNLTAGNYGWIQTSGKATCKFLATVTTAGAIGAGVYLATAANSNNNAVAADVGAFDTPPIAAGNATIANVDYMITRWVGVQEVAATNNNLSLVDMPMGRLYRW